MAGDPAARTASRHVAEGLRTVADCNKVVNRELSGCHDFKGAEGFRTGILVWSSKEPSYPTLTHEWP